MLQKFKKSILFFLLCNLFPAIFIFFLFAQSRKIRTQQLIRSAFLICIFAHLHIYSFAQHYNFTNFSVEDGLAQSQVTVIFQDSKAALWFGTYGGGVSRYDGVSFQNYTTKEGLVNNIVNAIIEDKQGNIWFATSGGISKFDRNKFTNYTEKNGLSTKLIWSVTQDKKGNLWFGTDGGGVIKYDGKIFTTYGEEQGLLNTHVWAAMTDKDGNMWFGTKGGGIFKFDGHDYFISYDTINSALADNRVWSILQDKQGNIWIATSKGVSKIVAGTEKYPHPVFQSYTKNNGLSDQRVWSILEDKTGDMWFGTNGGVFKLLKTPYDTANKFLNFTVKQGLSSDAVYSVIQDREGNYWFGTNGGGVCKYSGSKFINFAEDDGLSNNLVMSVFEDSKGNYWFGTREGGMSKYDGKTFTSYTEKEGLSHNLVYSIMEDHQGNMWFGTYNGATKYDGKEFQKYKYSTESGTAIPVYYLLEDEQENIWLATNKGVSKYDGKTFSDFTKNDGLPHNRVRYIMKDSYKNLWFGTDGGVSKYDGNKFYDFSKYNSFGNPMILNILEDKEGNIWFGTQGGGITKYCPDKQQQKNSNNQKRGCELFTAKDGLSDDNIMSMAFDENENMWIGTNKGICRFDLKEYKKSGKKIFRNYGKAEGFTGVECNQNAVLKDSKNHIWFGTIKGAIKYDSKEDHLNQTPPATHITNLRLFSENVDWTTVDKNIILKDGLPVNLKLSYKKNHVTFDYIGISLTAPDKVRYQYMLEGFDNNWSPVTKEIHATYSNLPPEKFTFKVRACNNDGVWNEVPITYSFTITPPFWRTWGFYLASAIVFMISIYLIIQWRIKHLQERQRVLEGMVEERTKQLKAEKEKVEQSNKEIVAQKEIIETKNKDITDSIQYAKRIQEAILPSKEIIYQALPNTFILYKPKAIVSGDFYWFSERKEKILIAAVDCTGHGVPGAFMSMIGNAILHEIVDEKHIVNPAEILQLLHEGVRFSLKQGEKETDTRDGMDIALISLEFGVKSSEVTLTTHNSQFSTTLEFAGAMRPLYLIRDGMLNEIKGDKLSIGGLHDSRKSDNFTSHKIPLQKNDVLYLFSDGCVDQFGGINGKKFLAKQFKRLLMDIQHLSMPEQEKKINETMSDWRGEEEQVDDILVIGIRI